LVWCMRQSRTQTLPLPLFRPSLITSPVLYSRLSWQFAGARGERTIAAHVSSHHTQRSTHPLIRRIWAPSKERKKNHEPPTSPTVYRCTSNRLPYTVPELEGSDSCPHIVCNHCHDLIGHGKRVACRCPNLDCCS
jgi:hypothetical protein